MTVEAGNRIFWVGCQAGDRVKSMSEGSLKAEFPFPDGATFLSKAFKPLAKANLHYGE